MTKFPPFILKLEFTFSIHVRLLNKDINLKLLTFYLKYVKLIIHEE